MSQFVLLPSRVNVYIFWKIIYYWRPTYVTWTPVAIWRNNGADGTASDNGKGRGWQFAEWTLNRWHSVLSMVLCLFRNVKPWWNTSCDMMKWQKWTTTPFSPAQMKWGAKCYYTGEEKKKKRVVDIVFLILFRCCI